MPNTLQSGNRGILKMTKDTYEKLERYMKRMPQTNSTVTYYGALPVERWTGQQDVWESPDGERTPICF